MIPIQEGWREMLPDEVATTEDMVMLKTGSGRWYMVDGLRGKKPSEFTGYYFIRKDTTPKPDPEWLNPDGV